MTTTTSKLYNCSVAINGNLKVDGGSILWAGSGTSSSTTSLVHHRLTPPFTATEPYGCYTVLSDFSDGSMDPLVITISDPSSENTGYVAWFTLDNPAGRAATISTSQGEYPLTPYGSTRCGLIHINGAWTLLPVADGRVTTFAPGSIRAHLNNTADGFCKTVALSGDGLTMAIAAHFVIDIYSRSRGGAEWALQHSIDNGTQTDPQLVSLALNCDGSRLAIGICALNNKAGIVWIYDRTGTSTWTTDPSTVLAPSDGVYNGYSVAMSGAGDLLAVGSYADPSVSVSAATDTGVVRLYRHDGTSWGSGPFAKVGNITDDSTVEGIGAGVALSSMGDFLFISSSTNLLVRVYIVKAASVTWCTDITATGSSVPTNSQIACNHSGTLVACSGKAAKAFDIYERVALFSDVIVNYKTVTISGQPSDAGFVCGLAMSSDGSIVVATYSASSKCYAFIRHGGLHNTKYVLRSTWECSDTSYVGGGTAISADGSICIFGSRSSNATGGIITTVF